MNKTKGCLIANFATVPVVSLTQYRAELNVTAILHSEWQHYISDITPGV
ncbi:hypothetical protein ACNFXF_26795 (plasmid) [Escherichia coli]